MRLLRWILPFALLLLGAAGWYSHRQASPEAAAVPKTPETRQEDESTSLALVREELPGQEVPESTSWSLRPDLRMATRQAFRRIQYQEGGEEEMIAYQERLMQGSGSKKSLAFLMGEPGLMEGLGMVPVQGMESLIADLLEYGRSTVANDLSRQRVHFEEMNRALENGQEYLPLGGMTFNALEYPPEAYLLRFTGKSWQGFDAAVLRDLGAIRDRHIHREGLLYQEESLMELSKMKAAQETGITFARSTRAAWREILPEYDRLEREREENRQQYEEEIRTYLLLNGFSSAGNQ